MSRTRIPIVPPHGRLTRANVALALASLFALGFACVEALLETLRGAESPLISLLAEPPWLFIERLVLLWMLPALTIYWLIGRFVPARWIRLAPWVHATLAVAHLAMAVYVVSLTASAMGAGPSFGFRRFIAGIWQMALAIGCLGLALGVWCNASRRDELPMAEQR